MPPALFKAVVLWVQELVEDSTGEEENETQCKCLMRATCNAPAFNWQAPYVKVRIGWKVVNGRRLNVYEYMHRLVCWSHWGWEGVDKSCALHKGKDGVGTCRKDRNKVVVCVNYKHLWWGDAGDNARDREMHKRRRPEG